MQTGAPFAPVRKCWRVSHVSQSGELEGVNLLASQQMPGRGKRQESAERNGAATLGGTSALLAAGLGRRGIIRASPIGGVPRTTAARGAPHAATRRTLVGSSSGAGLVLRTL